MTTTDEMIESLVEANYGPADCRVRHMFRQSLQILVELAKSEQRREIDITHQVDVRYPNRGTVH